MSSVIVDSIIKTYDKNSVTALDKVSFTVETGELFGLIGPDGAGKSSLFRILTTLLKPDKGKAIVNGWDTVKDYRQIRACVGYMPGRFSLYQDLTVQENLHFFATLFGVSVKDNYLLVKDIYDQLSPFKDRRAGQLSGGMKQKLSLCCALIHQPVILFLDEPTTGVDAVSRKEFWDMLARLKQQGITIVVSTPYMDEANACERIALIQKGTILSVNTPAGIVQSFPGKLFAVKSASMHRLLLDIRGYSAIRSCYAFGEWLHVRLKENEDPQQLRQWLVQKEQSDIEMKEILPTIEDNFMRLMEAG